MEGKRHDATPGNSDMGELSYALGMGIGRQLSQMGASALDIEEFAAALHDVLEGKSTRITFRAAQEMVQRYLAQQEAKLQAEREESGRAARKAGEEYLAANAKREGVVTLPSGLQYEVIRPGSGRKPKATDSVKCHYEGFLTDGTLFDSSLRRGEPATFGLQQVIAGWTEGLQLMQEGAKYRFYIPYRLGYGESGAGKSIPPYSALVFDVELIKVL